MQGYNVIIVFDPEQSRLLMCKRKKAPYKGLSNLVGGKIETGENGPAAAYRELREETGISRADITLHHLMDLTYYYSSCYLEVYVGRLRRMPEIAGEENELYWSDLSRNFFDQTLFAGEGNIGHMLEQVKLHAKEIFVEES